MAIAITCQSCGHSGRVGDNLYGKTVKCPKCGGQLRVGDSAPPSPPPARPGVPLGGPLSASLDDDDDAPYPISSRCPDCGSQMSPGAVICVKCGFDVRSGTKHKREDSPPPVPTYTATPMSDYSERSSSSSSRSSGGGEGGLGNIFWFILIFGVGNAILYYFTGILIIPIRR